MGSKPRRRIFIDTHVQGSFALRAISYWLGCMTVVMGLAVLWRLLARPTEPFFNSNDEMWACLGPLVVATVLVLPAIVYDIISITHRLIGPIIRLRGAMKRLVKGEQVQPIRFRKGDFWQEFADEFNVLAAYVQSQREAAQKAAGPAVTIGDVDDGLDNSETENQWAAASATSER